MDLKTFISESKTFNGFVFTGNYTMPCDVFIKIYEIYNNFKVNLLDHYSNYIYLSWYSYESSEIWDRDKTTIYENSLSLLRKYKLVDVDDLGEQRSKLKWIYAKYTAYLNKLLNEPRQKACSFTSKKEIRNYIFSLYGNKCLCCNSEKNLTMDHVMPIIKGGLNVVENLQPLFVSLVIAKRELK
jgi:hypothetical protein